MHLLRQSTVATVLVGPVLDASGVAVTTAVVGDFRIAKEGTTAVLSGATVTHDANGYYRIALTTGNTDTVGRLAIYSNNTAQSMGTMRFTVLLPSVYDAFIANATNSTGGLPTATGSVTALAGAISTFNSATNTVTLAAATHTGAVIPTVTAVTNAVTLPSSATINIIGNLTGNVTGSVGSVTGNVGGSVGSIAGVTFPSNFGSLAITVLGGVTVASNGDKTGYSLLAGTGLGNQTANITGNLSGSVGSVIGNVGGNVNGSVGSISGVTFPTHFDNLAIDPNGHVTATVDSINNNAITASSIQANALTSAKFAPDSITASALATDAVNEVRDAVAAITPIADLATMIINDGTANARYSVSALQNGPSGAGGSTINVYPVSASTPERVAGTTITFYRDENRSVSVVTDFVLDALTLEFVVEDSEGTDLLVIANGSISKSNKTFTVTIGTSVTATISNYRWSLRDLTGGSNSVIARGVLSVQEAASNG